MHATSTVKAMMAQTAGQVLNGPLLAIFLIAIPLWCAVAWLGIAGAISALAAIPLMTIAAYVGFTVIHECVHGNMSRYPTLNALFGNLASVVLGPTACFRAYRYLHLEHHRCTNDPKRDPDFWSGYGSKWLLPLRWLTTDLYYYWFYLRRMRTRPMGEQLEIFIVSAFYVVLFAVAWIAGYGTEALVYWVLPARIAIMALSFTFNYLPHTPYQVKAEDDVYRATRVLLGPDWFVTPLFMFHNYHLVHHIYPRAPFYHYPALWRDHQTELLGHGAVATKIFN